MKKVKKLNAADRSKIRELLGEYFGRVGYPAILSAATCRILRKNGIVGPYQSREEKTNNQNHAYKNKNGDHSPAANAPQRASAAVV